MFTAALFIVVKIRMNPNIHQLMNGYKMWYVHMWPHRAKGNCGADYFYFYAPSQAALSSAVAGKHSWLFKLKVINFFLKPVPQSH